MAAAGSTGVAALRRLTIYPVSLTVTRASIHGAWRAPFTDIPLYLILAAGSYAVTRTYRAAICQLFSPADGPEVRIWTNINVQEVMTFYIRYHKSRCRPGQVTENSRKREVGVDVQGNPVFSLIRRDDEGD